MLAAQCGDQFAITSDSKIKQGNQRRKRRSPEYSLFSEDEEMEDASRSVLNRGELTFIDRAQFRKQALLAKARRECLSLTVDADPLFLSKILAEKEKPADAISLALAWDVSPAYALAVHLANLQQQTDDSDELTSYA